MSRTRRPRHLEDIPANDNLRQPEGIPAVALESACKPPVAFPERLKNARRLRHVDIRLPAGMPVQIVEVEVLAELLDSLPRVANDDDQG
jgi:hypothetical protein